MAKKKTAKKSGVSNAQKLGIGVGLTTAAVAAAGAYFLYGSSDAPKNRKKVQSWALKAKADVLEALENAEEMTEQEFHALIDGVANTYGKVQKLSQKEVAEFKKEMSGNWKHLLASGAMQMIAAEKVAKKTAKKTAKKVAKKTAKKAVKKATKKKK